MFTNKHFLRITQSILIGLFSIISIYGAAGDVDTSFNASVSTNIQGFVGQTLVQPDGKIIISGEFKIVNGRERINLARLNGDGTLDNSFNPPTILSAGAGWAINSIALQSNGKIVIGGQFAQLGNISRRGLARLNSDGSPDNSFNNSSSLNNLSIVTDLDVSVDDKIVFSGYSLFGQGQPVFSTLNSDGSLIASNNDSVAKVLFQPDGKILALNFQSVLKRYNQNLTPDTSFSELSISGSVVGDIAVQTDGKILIGGSFGSVNGFDVQNIARVNSNGSLDGSFNTNGGGTNGTISKIVIQNDGKIFIGGAFTTYNSTARTNIAKLNADGTLNGSFINTRGYVNLYDLDLQTDGKVIVSSGSVQFTVTQIERLNVGGTLDTTFQASVGSYGTVFKVLVQPDNKILVAGDFTRINTEATSGLSRLMANGLTDLPFTQNIYGSANVLFDVALQSDGKIIAPSNYFGSNPTRYNSDGTINFTYSNSAFQRRYVEVQPDGKALFSGGGMARYNANGSVDSTFNSNVSYNDSITLANSRIIVFGSFTQVGTENRGRIARLFSDGSLDTSFNPPFGANDTINDAVIQTDGKILIGGQFTGVNGDTSKKYLARLNADGSLDTSFSPVIDAPVFTIKLQADNRILVGGAFSSINGTQRVRIARLNPGGDMDFLFNPGSGANSTVRDIEIQQNGGIIVAGEFNRFNGVPAIGIVRLLNSNAPPRSLFDYDGDGKADVSVFRASENKWYILQSSDFAVVQKVFAIAGDVPTPADYDGDGKTDVAIFRPATGDWWYLSSINNAQIQFHWGQAGDIPRPGDFDGDGKTDFIVYRPSNSVWYRYGSTGAVSILAFGISEDKPLVGDFDGDGKIDFAIFRPSTGDWWYAASSAGNQFRAVHWGATGDIPVPADYDGDGKTDYAVYRPSNGGWYIANSANGSYTIQAFGLPTDKPIAADYDGDGKADIAVFRPSTGTWYLLQTTAGFGALQFGVSNDIPTPNAFIQ
jgi:uncharacterized delta-60 repeat protein